MDRALFPDDVEIRQPALQYEADQVAFHILRRWVDGGSAGVATGLAVTQNLGNGTLVDIAAGEGFVPNNELAQLMAPILGIALSDYTLGLANYICLLYTENQVAPGPHITDGTPRFTQAARAVIPIVYTLAEIQALPATSSNLAVSAQDRLLVCAIVPGNGLTLGVPNPIVPGQIQLPPSGFRILTIDQPTNVTGVVIIAIDETTPAMTDVGGTFAKLQWTPGSGLRYWASGDVSYGAYVPITTSGVYQLISTDGHFINVDVTTEMLSSVTQADVTLVTADVYPTGLNQSFSANDRVHRHLIGSGIPTPKNPHGLRFVDLAEDIATLPEGIVLGVDLMSNDAQAIIPRIVTRQSQFGNGRTLLWDIPLFAAPPAPHIRFYASSAGALEIVTNAFWDPVAGKWTADNTADGASKFEFYDGGVQNKEITVTTVPWDDTVSGTGWRASAIDADGTAGLAGLIHAFGQIQLGERLLAIGGSAANLTPRIIADYNPTGAGGDIRTLLLSSENVGFAGPNTVRLYRSNTSQYQSDGFELTINALWNAGTTNWNKDSPGSQAAKFEFGHEALVYYIQTLDPPWADNAWQSQSFYADNVNGVISDQGFISNRGIPAITALSTASPFNPRWAAVVDSGVASRYLTAHYFQAGVGIVREYISFAASLWAREVTMNARWDGANWNRDTAATAQRYVWNALGNTLQSFDATISSVWNDASWFSADFFSLVPGTASFLFDGILQFPAGPNTNPAATAAFKNKLLAKSLIKAWAHIQFTGIGPNYLTLLDGFNVQSNVALSSNVIVLQFAQAMADTNYVTNVTLLNNFSGNFEGAAQPFVCFVQAQMVNQVIIAPVSQTGGGQVVTTPAVDLQALTAPVAALVTVMGLQT